MDGSEVRSEDGRPCHQESQGRVAQGADVGHVAWFCPIDPNRNHSEDCFYVPKCAARVPLPAQPLERRGSRAAVARDDSVDCAVKALEAHGRWKSREGAVVQQPKLFHGLKEAMTPVFWEVTEAQRLPDRTRGCIEQEHGRLSDCPSARLRQGSVQALHIPRGQPQQQMVQLAKASSWLERPPRVIKRREVAVE